MNSQPMPETNERQLLSRSLKVAGGLLIALGIVSIIVPWAAAIAIEAFLGVVFLLAGFGELIFAWEFRSVDGAAWRFLRAAGFLAAGVLLFVFPLVGIGALTLVLGILFFADGLLRLMLAAHLQRNQGFVIVDGVLGILLGIVILIGWPGNAPWILGILVGIRLLMTGVALWMIGSAFRSTHPPM